MTTNRNHPARFRFAPILLAGTLVLAGCTNTEEPQGQESVAPTAEAPDVEGTPGGSQTGVEATPKQTGKPPEALGIEDKALQKAAEDYINARENQASHFHKKPTDWLDDVKEYMTSEGHKRLTDRAGSAYGAAGGYAWDVSHEEGLAVKAQVGECSELTQAGGNTDTKKTVSCSVLDVVVDKDDKNVPTTEIPPTWPYVGEQQNALLEMRKDGEGWKVHMDMTGMAN